MKAPAIIFEATTGPEGLQRRYTAEFLELKKRLSAEGNDDALRPNANWMDRVLYYAKGIKNFIYGSLERMTEE